VKKYEKAFSDIKEKTGIEDNKLLVKKFEEAEVVNYSLFTYVKNLILENDRIDEEIRQAKLLKEKLIRE